MKKVFNLVFIVSLIFGSLYAQKSVELVFKPNKKLSSSFKPKGAKMLYVSYDEVPHNGYVGELIGLKIKAITPLKFESIYVKDTNLSMGSIKDLNPAWEKIDENIYTKTIYYQAKIPLEKLPNFNVELLMQDGKTENSVLKSKDINIIKINDDDGKFINIFAKNLEIKKYKTTRFDQDSLIMIMEIVASEANIDDIYFKNYKKQGSDSKSGKFPNNSLFYYLIIKQDTVSVDFSYFNTNENAFVNISLPVVLSQDDLSTQIGLNPKKSRFELYKEIAAGALCVLFLVLLIFKRKIIFAFLALVFGGYLLFNKLSFYNISLKQGSKIRILPTQNSTIFSTIKQNTKVEKLDKYEDYIKVILPNGKIGWAEEDDVIKN